MSSPDRVNIYLSNVEVERLNKKPTENMAQVYLIQNNDKMKKDQIAMEKIIQRHEDKINELEDEIERLETSAVNLRGFVKNVGEMNKINNQLSSTYKTFQEKTGSLLKDQHIVIQSVGTHQILSFASIISLMFILWWFNGVDFSHVVFEISMQGAIFASFYINFNKHFSDAKHYIALQKKYNAIIKESHDELKEAEKGNDFLNDLVDLL